MTATTNPERIKSCLADGLEEALDIADRLGIDEGTVRRQLKRMESLGEVARRQEGITSYWRLAESAEPQLEPAPAHELPPAEPERVKLVEELLEIERMLIDAAQRRAEILEALR